MINRAIAAARVWHFFVLALLLRGAATLALYHPLPAHPGYDVEDYIQGARWFFGREPRMALAHPPLYGIFLVLTFTPWGEHLWTALLVQILISSLCVVGVYILTQRLFGKSAAFWAALWVLLDPFLIRLCTQLLSETLFTTLLVFGILVLMRNDPQRKSTAFISGVLISLACLTRNALMSVVGLFPLYLLLSRRNTGKRPLMMALCWLGGFLIPLVGWSTFVSTQTGHFQITTPSIGWTMYEGLNPHFDNPVDIAQWQKAQHDEEMAQAFPSAFERDAYFRRKSMQMIKTHPYQTATLMVRKFFKFWRLYPYRGYYSLGQCILSGVYMTPFLFFALLGLYKAWQGDRAHDSEVFFFVAFILIYSLSATLMWTEIRYRVPLDPLLAIFAGIGLGL